MQKIQEDRRTMIGMTSKTLSEAPAEVAADMTGTAGPIATLAEKVVEIKTNAVLQSEDLTGFAVEKQRRRDLMEFLTLYPCRKAASYAFNNTIPVLLHKVDITASYLAGLTNAKSADECQSMHDVIYPYLADLVTYDVTAATLTGVNDAIVSFLEFKDKPRTNINVRKTATRNIGRLLGECDEILEGTDYAVEGIKDVHPEFYTKYKDSRQIINTGGRVISLRGNVKTAAGVALKGVRIEIEGAKLVKRSSAKGNFQVKHLDEGVYQVLLKHAGFEDVQVSVAIVLNQRTELVVVMKEFVAA